MVEFMPLPKYHRVYLALKERLRDTASLADGQRLPGEMALMDEFGVSRVTVRKALANLAAEGLIERAAGRGTRRVPTPGGELLQGVVARSAGTSVQVLEHGRRPATPAAAAALGLEPGAPAMRIVRLRSNGDGPVSHVTIWLPAAAARALARRKLDRRPVLALLADAGVHVARAHQRISARAADAPLAQQLQVPVGAPLLAIDRVVYDREGQAVQWLQGLHRPDRYVYDTTLATGVELRRLVGQGGA